MADENKLKLSMAKSANEWVETYYGENAADVAKKDKIKHVGRVAEFASICYVISKNSKQAHVDFFESNYTASSTKVDKAATLIIKLLELQTRDGGMHVITQDEFNKAAESCGLHNFVKNDQIFEDYTNPEKGLVKTCQSLFPIYTDSSKNADLMKDIIGDLDETRKDHAQLRALTNGSEVSMKLEDILGMRYKIMECASKNWNKFKDAKSKGQFELSDAKEAFIEDERDLAFKTGKVAMLGGTAAVSLGAVVGGAFWPAFLLIPVYALGKKWIPDFAKSLGKLWGGMENQRKIKRKIARADAQIEYLQLWATYGNETDVKKHLSRKSRRLLRGIDKDCLKKQGKLMQGAVSTEIFETDADGNIVYKNDGKPKMKMRISETESVFDAIAHNIGTLQNPMETENLAPADAEGILDGKRKKIESSSSSSTFADFIELANTYEKLKGKLPPDADLKFKNDYAETLKKCAEHLIFETKMDSVTDTVDKTTKYLAEDSTILSVIKDVRPDVVSAVRRYVTFASKELTNLNGDYVGKTLHDYVFRDPELEGNAHFDASAPELSLDPALTAFSYPTDTHLGSAISAIADLKVSSKDENNFVGNGLTIANINNEIAQIANSGDREKCNKLLKEQMKRVSYEKARSDSRATYNALVTGEFGGKLDFNELFKKIGEVNYENVDTYSAFYEDTKKMEPKQVGSYIRMKFRKAVYDVMLAYANSNKEKFKNNLKELSTYLKRVNACAYLDEKQKLDLSSAVSGYVAMAFDNKYTDLTETFMQDNGYNTNEFSDYLKSYEFGGFKELFDSDQSVETQVLRENIVYMRDLQDVYKSLKLNEQFDLNKDEAKYIAESLLSDRSTGNMPIIRGNNDPLRMFITENIKNMDTNFGTNVEAVTITTKQPYMDLVNALNKIRSMPTSSVKECYDQYTALIILKNKCTSLFRLCMKDYVQGHFTGSKSIWIDTNSALIDDIKNVWKDGIMKDIDDTIDTQLAYYMSRDHGFAKGTITTARSELSKYGVGSEVEKMLTERQL